MWADQKKERESVARGNVSLGMGASNGVRAREGSALRPLPEQQSEIESWKSSHKNSGETSSIEIESSSRNQQIVRTATSETNGIVLTDMEVLTVKVLNHRRTAGKHSSRCQGNAASGKPQRSGSDAFST